MKTLLIALALSFFTHFPSLADDRVSEKDWRAAIESIFTKRNYRSTDGVESFGACFPGRRACLVTEYDRFSMSYRFSPLMSAANFPSHMFDSLGAHVFISRCSGPSLAISAAVSSGFWLMLDSALILAGDSAPIRINIDKNNVFRTVDRHSNNPFEEVGHTVLSDAQVLEIERVIRNKPVVIRISGDSGYLVVKKKDATYFPDDFMFAVTALRDFEKVLAGRVSNGCRQ